MWRIESVDRSNGVKVIDVNGMELFRRNLVICDGDKLTKGDKGTFITEGRTEEHGMFAIHVCSSSHKGYMVGKDFATKLSPANALYYIGLFAPEKYDVASKNLE